MHGTLITRPNGRRDADVDEAALVSVEAERQFLGCVIELIERDRKRARELLEAVPLQMLTDPTCRDVAAAVAAAFRDHDQPTRVDILAVIRRTGGGNEAARQLLVSLTEELSALPQAARLADDAAHELRELHHRREALEVLSDIQRGIRDGTASLEALGDVTQQLERLRDAKLEVSGSRPLTLVDCVNQWAEAGTVVALPTGLRPFDQATDGGLPLGGITALIAPPKAGKSAMAIQLTLGAMLQDPSLRAVYALAEMSPMALARRAACVGSYLLDCEPVTVSQAKRLTRHSRESAARVVAEVGDRLTVVRPPVTVAQMAAAVAKADAKLLVVDYLQLVKGDGDTKVDKLEQIVEELQLLAVSRGVAIIMVSSMAIGRTGGNLAAHEYGKGTGTIGYGAELIYVAVVDKDADPSGPRPITWKCIAGRDLPTVDVELLFDGPMQTFLPVERPIDDFADFAAEGVA